MKEYIYGQGAREAERLARQTTSEAKFLGRVIDLVGIQPGQHVIDFGSGEGSVTLLLANRVRPKGYVVGIEIDTKRVKISQQKAKEKGVSNVSLSKAMFCSH